MRNLTCWLAAVSIVVLSSGLGAAEKKAKASKPAAKTTQPADKGPFKTDLEKFSYGIGMNMAKELVFTGKMISAADAEKIGLVNKVVPPDQLMEEVIKTAKEIASKGKTSLRAAKQAINHGMNADLATGIHIEIEGFGMCYGSSDAKEGTSAFLEKRKPNFKGSLKD